MFKRETGGSRVALLAFGFLLGAMAYAAPSQAAGCKKSYNWSALLNSEAYVCGSYVAYECAWSMMGVCFFRP